MIRSHCTLEINESNGVATLYVHNHHGKTLVRVSQIPSAAIKEHQLIDVLYDREIAKGME